jgi:hypothetical protein
MGRSYSAVDITDSYSQACRRTPTTVRNSNEYDYVFCTAYMKLTSNGEILYVS